VRNGQQERKERATAQRFKSVAPRADPGVMGRVLGLLAIVMGLWIAAEVYTEGVDAAFGGAFAGLADPVVPLDELHSGGGRDGQGAPRASGGDDDILVVGDDEGPFEPRSTPVTRLGAHVQGEIDSAYGSRYGE